MYTFFFEIERYAAFGRNGEAFLFSFYLNLPGYNPLILDDPSQAMLVLVQQPFVMGDRGKGALPMFCEAGPIPHSVHNLNYALIEMALYLKRLSTFLYCWQP